MKHGGASAAQHFSPGPDQSLEWRWAQNIALSRADDQVFVLIGTHGQVPIKQDGSFMPHTVRWDAAKYPGTVCGVQSTIFGQANFMSDSDANRVEAEIMRPITIESDNALVDFAEKLKKVDTGMPDMARQGASYLDEIAHRWDRELQVLPLLTAHRPSETKLLRYAAFRYSPTGVDEPHTNQVSLINKEFLIDRGCESTEARQTHNEWHINIFYKDIRGNMKKVDLFPLLVSKGAPLSKKRTGMVADSRVTNMQNIVDALHVAGFLRMLFIDLTCFVFRQPLSLGDEWTLRDDHFSRILRNMIARYNFRLMKTGSVRKNLPGHADFNVVDIQKFRRHYLKMLEAVGRRDSAAVDGPRCARQLAAIADEERNKIEATLALISRRRKRRKHKRSVGVGVVLLKGPTKKIKPKNPLVGSVRKPSSIATLRIKTRPTTDWSMGADSEDSDSSMGASSDSSMGASPDSSPDSSRKMPEEGGRRRRTRKFQKRRRTNLRNK